MQSIVDLPWVVMWPIIAAIGTALWLFFRSELFPAITAAQKEKRSMFLRIEENKIKADQARIKEIQENENELKQLVRQTIEVMTSVEHVLPRIVEAINVMSNERFNQISDLQHDVTGIQLDIAKIAHHLNVEQPSKSIRRPRKTVPRQSQPASEGEA